MNALIEMVKLIAVTQGGMKSEVANMIGDTLESGADAVSELVSSMTDEAQTATVRNLLASAQSAAALGETELAAAFLGRAGEIVAGNEEEDEDEPAELPMAEGAVKS